MDLLTLDQNSIRKTVTSSYFTKKPRSTKNKHTKHFFLFRNEGRPSSTFSQFRQNRQLTSHTKTDVNYTINSNKNIAYFRDILNYSKGLINKYNQDKLGIKLNNTVLFNLNSLFNKGNYIPDNNKLIKQFIDKEYIDFIKYEEEKYGN